MVKRLALALLGLGIGAIAIFLVLTAPKTISASDLPNHKGDPINGAFLFNAGGCGACHAAPETRDPTAARELPGGGALVSDFGTFRAPNISPDPVNGIGKWSNADFVNAMKYGVSPDGRHYYPAFPYVAFQRMSMEDLIDLKAYLDTLPPIATPNQAHDLPFPFNIRRGVGIWKLLYVDGKTFVPDPKASAEVNRGAYIVEGPAHCGECHTPRNFFGGPIAARAFSGGPSLDGKGFVPNITPHASGIGAWTREDIVEALTTGFTPEFDSLGGEMTKVTRETRRMNEVDRNAIAAYLLRLKPIDSPRPPKAGR